MDRGPKSKWADTQLCVEAHLEDDRALVLEALELEADVRPLLLQPLQLRLHLYMHMNVNIYINLNIYKITYTGTSSRPSIGPDSPPFIAIG